MPDTDTAGLLKALDSLAEYVGVAAGLVREEQAKLAAAVTRMTDELETERALRTTAERNAERFRYALWVYLQERDGPAGPGAPTPETLKLIRETVAELQA